MSAVHPLIPAALPWLAGRSQLRSPLLADDCWSSLQLPEGLSGLHQLAVPAMLVARNLPALAAAASLRLLALLSCDTFLCTPEPDEFWGILDAALRLPQLGRLLMVTRDEMAEDARAALAYGWRWVRQVDRRPPNLISFMIAPDAFRCPEVKEMAAPV